MDIKKEIKCLPNEEWRDMVGYEDIYMVSSYGRIYIKSNIKKLKNGKLYKRGNKIKILKYTKGGYLESNFNKQGKIKTIRIHKAVAQAFIPNPNNYNQIDHINGIRDDNRVENLRWCTPKMNANFDLSIKNRSIAQKKSYEKGRKVSQWLVDNNNKTKIGLYMYSLNGDFIRHFESMLDAGHYVNGFILHKSCENLFYFKGYVFSKEKIVDFSIFPYKEPITKAKTIIKYNNKNEIVVKYKSINEASKKEGITVWKMRHILEKGKSLNDYYFKYL